MLRPTIDKALPITTTLTHKVYDVEIPDPFIADIPIGSNPELVKVTHPAFAPQGKFYHKRHLMTEDGKHRIKVPIARKMGCNFNKPAVDIASGLGKHLKNALNKKMNYSKYMRKRCPQNWKTADFKKR